MSVTIRPATTASDLAAIRTLFQAYADSLPVDLAYQGFATEVATLPGAYGPPMDLLLLAHDHQDLGLGCVALRPLAEDGCCEMKRLYVVPAARGLGLGRQLVLAVIEAARKAGYRELRLDTLPSMTGAQTLYRALGFVPIPPYYDTPIEGTEFLSLAL